MKRVGIIAALPGELKPLVRNWQQRGLVYFGKIDEGKAGEIECIAACAGMGAEAATRSCDLVLAEGKLDALVSYGWAGSLSCGIKPPSVCAIYDIIDSRTGDRFVTDYPAGNRLITLDHVARSGEKRELAEKYQAPLVDMEAATVARIAAARNIAFYCFKGVSDGANDKLPDFNRFLGKDGQLRMPVFVAYALLHPGYWTALKQLGRHSARAAEELASFVPRSLGEALKPGNAVI
jgi:adenosylhomocysteine nucleosidase